MRDREKRPRAPSSSFSGGRPQWEIESSLLLTLVCPISLSLLLICGCLCRCLFPQAIYPTTTTAFAAKFSVAGARFGPLPFSRVRSLLSPPAANCPSPPPLLRSLRWRRRKTTIKLFSLCCCCRCQAAVSFITAMRGKRRESRSLSVWKK